MLSNEENIDYNLFISKKTKPTRSSEANSISAENDKQDIEQDNQSFHKRITEKELMKGKRYDNYGNLITKNGKQRVTFIDKVKPVNLIEVIPIESFKEYNVTEEINTKNISSFNSCCNLF